MALSLTVAAPAWAQSWGAPTAIAGSQTYARSATVRIHGNGDAVAAWLESTTAPASNYGVAATTFSTAGGWAVAGTIYVPSAAWMSGLAPAVVAGPNGSATVAWGNSTGAWVADRAAAQGWGAALNLAPAATNAWVASNRAGDTVVAWADPSYAAYRSVWALRKPAGGAWGSPEVVATAGTSVVNFGWYTSVFVTAVTIAESGEALVVWESLYSSRPCGGKGCGHINTTSVARQANTLSPWTSGVVASVSVIGKPVPSNPYKPVLDSQGRAALLWSTNGGSVWARTQQGAGQAWSAATAAVPSYPSPFPSAYPIRTLVAAASDAAGNVTLALTTSPPVGGGILAVDTVTGSIESNTWTSPTGFAKPSDGAIASPVLDVSPSGAAVLSWAVIRPLGQSSLHAMLRSNGTAAWGAPAALAVGSRPTPASVSINDAGQAAVLYVDDVNVTAGQKGLFAVTN